MQLNAVSGRQRPFISWVWGQSGLQNKVQDNQGDIEKILSWKKKSIINKAHKQANKNSNSGIQSNAEKPITNWQYYLQCVFVNKRTSHNAHVQLQHQKNNL